MNDSERKGLLERVEAFELDDPVAQLPFTSRLAREQGWTHAFAGRVVTEYKRFMGLTVVAGHPVSPPEGIDQVWHLHLVYTKSYWQDFCGGVLGREVHHFPTMGGGEETAKFEDWYGRTLESYRRHFGGEPPAEIWPPVEEKAKSGGLGRWVEASKFWLVPRPAWTGGNWWRRMFSKSKKA